MFTVKSAHITLSSSSFLFKNISCLRLRELEKEDILDTEYDTYSEVDVEAQRLAWLGVGKKEVEEWDDEKVKKTAFKKKVFMKAKIKILNAVEDFKFTINMF